MKYKLNNFYNEDCLEAMKKIPDKYFDLAIVDPPYGGNDAIGIKNGNSHTANRKGYKIFKNVQPEQEYFDELKRVSKKQIIWGVNFYKVKGLEGGRIVWDKKGTAFGRGEIAYYSHSKSVEIYEFAWNGMIQGNMKNKENRIHPTQKPVELYLWLLNNYAKKGDKILDTHVGSASSLVACHELGYDFIGFELDEDYYKEASARLERSRNQLKLF